MERVEHVEHVCGCMRVRACVCRVTKWPAAQASSLTVGLLDRRKRDVSGEAGRDEAEHAAQRLPPGHVRERLEENGAVGEDHGRGAERFEPERYPITVRTVVD